ncbi:Amidohydrolase family protein [Acetitomaculum ruminis DSM 5522]|uniref:Amidohydrolase family protein n=1 Tax=Acetitomaculum ruminis DSM 5522 TaxID=1120918 RepID=A0A1I0V4L8_9FIRM|nr:amidohydrolase family protein [Acetitomaculum ruminis]SFA71212.1 Amidohydrolase family protein [Acetitomaculum ruminis DSM 5522]
MYCECHGHIALNGINYKLALETHKDKCNEDAIYQNIIAYKEAGIEYFREGGDKWGASIIAKDISKKISLTYKSPVFAIHKKGYYGSILGKSFENMKDYKNLVNNAYNNGADFIKVMISGIMDYNEYGKISEYHISEEELKNMVNIAHKKGLNVMAHCNGKDKIKAAIKAGVSSIEHGFFMDDECIELLSKTEIVWVPTLTPVKAVENIKDFDKNVILKILKLQENNIRKAANSGCYIASGSDAGSVNVPHKNGLLSEVDYLKKILGDKADEIIHKGNKKIIELF